MNGVFSPCDNKSLWWPPHHMLLGSCVGWQVASSSHRELVTWSPGRRQVWGQHVDLTHTQHLVLLSGWSSFGAVRTPHIHHFIPARLTFFFKSQIYRGKTRERKSTTHAHKFPCTLTHRYSTDRAFPSAIAFHVVPGFEPRRYSWQGPRLPHELSSTLGPMLCGGWAST